MQEMEIAHFIKIILQLTTKLISGTLTLNTVLHENKKAKLKYTRVALIVGHDKYSPGALAYNGEYERFYNGKVAKLASKLVSKRKCKVFYIDRSGRKGVAENAAKWAGDSSLSIELHFNSHTSIADGTECLVLQNDYGSYEIGKKLVRTISDEFNTKVRHANGLKAVSKYDRGGMNLEYARLGGIECSVLIEPFFGNYKTKESQAFLEKNGWSRYANILASFIDNL